MKHFHQNVALCLVRDPDGRVPCVTRSCFSCWQKVLEHVLKEFPCLGLAVQPIPLPGLQSITFPHSRPICITCISLSALPLSALVLLPEPGLQSEL